MADTDTDHSHREESSVKETFAGKTQRYRREYDGYVAQAKRVDEAAERAASSLARAEDPERAEEFFRTFEQNYKRRSKMTTDARVRKIEDWFRTGRSSSGTRPGPLNEYVVSRFPSDLTSAVERAKRAEAKLKQQREEEQERRNTSSSADHARRPALVHSGGASEDARTFDKGHQTLDDLDSSQKDALSNLKRNLDKFNRAVREEEELKDRIHGAHDKHEAEEEYDRAVKEADKALRLIKQWAQIAHRRGIEEHLVPRIPSRNPDREEHDY